MRTSRLFAAAAAMSSAFSLGCLLMLLNGRWPAYLDLAPIRNGWPLVTGSDDGVPDAPLFHLADWIVSSLLGMGVGVTVVTWLCMFAFLTGAGLFYRSLGASGFGGVTALAVCSFVLTRYSHGQVAFLAGVGFALCALSLGESNNSRARVFLCLFISGLLSPHASLIGVMAFFSMRKTRQHVSAAVLGALLSVWPTVVYGYGVVGDTGSFEASRPWYETLFLQSGFWHQDAGTVGSFIVLVLASCSLWRFRGKVTSLLHVWGASCVAYTTARMAKHLMSGSGAVAFLRDEHKIMVLGSVALSGLAGIFLENNKKTLYLAGFVSLAFVGAWSAQNQDGFTAKETAALSALSRDVTGEVAVWPSTRYNRLSDGGVVAQDTVSRVLEGGTKYMGESGVRSQMSEWMASGGGTNFRPYFSTLVVIKYGQQGYEWLEDLGTKRYTQNKPYGDYFDVIDLKESRESDEGDRNAVIALYYSVVAMLSIALVKIRH